MMIREIAYKEWIAARRSRLLWLLGGMLMLLLAAGTWTGMARYDRDRKLRQEADSTQRAAWVGQRDKHPHIAAHFGNFAFKPVSALGYIDFGIDDYAGSYAYLEPHRQNEFLFPPSETFDTGIRFGAFSVSMVLQLLFPLLIIFLSFRAFGDERERGTLPMLLSQGVSQRMLVAGKIAGIGSMVVCLFLALFLPAAVIAYVGGGRAEPLSGYAARIGLLALLYSIYYVSLTALCVWVSCRVFASKTTLVLLLTGWILGCLLVPKISANLGSNRYPLPSAYELRERIRQGMRLGIDGHSPHDARAEALKQTLLRKYHVDSVDRLPFNYEGYVMEAGEEYSSKVYDRNMQEIQTLIVAQNRTAAQASRLDPFMAVRELSMALCGTDYPGYLDFQRHAETYRRQFVQQMNRDMMTHSTLGDWNYKAGKSLYRSVPPFRYRSPGIADSLRLHLPSVLTLFAWLCLPALLLIFTPNKPLRQ